MSRIDSIFPTSAMRCLLCALALCTATGVMAKSLPCAPGVTPWLSLTITAGTVIAVSDRIISVRVHDNGCVELHRPAFYRRAGDYRLQLSKPELAALRGTVLEGNAGGQAQDFDLDAVVALPAALRIVIERLVGQREKGGGKAALDQGGGKPARMIADAVAHRLESAYDND